MKLTRFYKKEDGAEIKIVAELFNSPGFKFSVGNFVMHRKNDNDNWRLCPTPPFAIDKKMSRAEYMKNGRPEMYRLASFGQLLSVNSELKKMASDSFGFDVEIMAT